MSILAMGVEAIERGLVPDSWTRLAIRRLCRQRLMEFEDAASEQAVDRAEFWESLHRGPIAPVPEKANEQHYELPAEFFGIILGPRRKYSCCYWPDQGSSLPEAEDAALNLTCQHAQLHDGQDVLELGCGWGSLSLWIAERYPTSRVTAVSNSNTQRRFIQSTAARLGLSNLCVITADINGFRPPNTDGDGRFDRVVSVEMFEHMRNYYLLLARIASWLRPDGKLFVHHFCHRESAYPFETTGKSDWMGRHFFTGGMMPSANLLRRFDRDLSVAGQWTWNGCHYQRTAEAWLRNLDANRHEVLEILKTVYGRAAAGRWLQRWRMFLLAVSELFGYGNGEQWFVSHSLVQRSPTPASEVAPCLSFS